MLTEHLRNWAMAGLNLPQPWGYIVAGGLMALESMIAPIPSEVVMPPLGMLVHEGVYSWHGAIIATSIGSLAGSVISYYLGLLGGKPLVMKVGRFLLINEHHLDLTTQWFQRYGSATVFICRFIPVVRHFISIPAGIARMNLLKFCLFTLVGATLWNTFLLYLGYVLQDKWESILKYRGPIDVAVIILLVAAIVAWFWIHLRKKPAADATSAPSEAE